MEHTKTTFKHPGDLDSEIWEWLKEHGTEETKQVIMMTARHFAEWGAINLNTRGEESVGVAESPLKTFPKVNDFECGGNYRH